MNLFYPELKRLSLFFLVISYPIVLSMCFYSDVLTSAALLTLGKLLLYGLANSLVRETKTHLWPCLPYANFRATLSPFSNPLCDSYIPSQYSSALIIPSPGTRQFRTAPILQILLQVLRLANPKPDYPVSPVLSHGNHNKGTCFCFCPHCLCLLASPGASPCGPAEHGMPPPLGNCHKISFPWQSSPDLLVSQDLNNNKTHILKCPCCYLCSSLSCISIPPQCEPLRRRTIFCPTL